MEFWSNFYDGKLNKCSCKVLYVHSRRGDVEYHLLKLIKPYSSLLDGYKKFVSTIRSHVKEAGVFYISSNGQDHLRLKTRSSVYNSLYYSFEIEKILTSRKGIRSKYKDSIPLNFASKFLPLFSLTFDGPIYSVYWGSKSYYLSNSNNDILLLKAKDPTAVEFSSFNFVEPKQVEPIDTNENMRKLGIFYLFNWLLPPKDPSKLDEIWWESPFIYFDESHNNSYLEILLINKTISYSTMNTVKILDRNLSWVDVTKLCKSNDNDYGFKASIIIRKFILQPDFDHECYIIPLDKAALMFDDDREELGSGEDILYTLISIILRKLYLSSRHPFVIDKDTLIDAVKKFLADNPQFVNEINGQLGSRFLDYNIDFIINALGVYSANEKSIIYLHPTLYEVLLFLKGRGADNTIDKLLNFFISQTFDKNSPVGILEFHKKVIDYFGIKKNEEISLSISLMHLPRVVRFSKIIKGVKNEP